MINNGINLYSKAYKINLIAEFFIMKAFGSFKIIEVFIQINYTNSKYESF
jgi:hypothetical protein